MRNYVSLKNLSERIKAGLQLCNQGINKGKYSEQEYKLFCNLAKLYLQKGDVKEYPKVIAIYQYLKKLVEKQLKGDKQKLEWLDAQIKDAERRFLESEAVKKIHLNPTSIGTDAKAMAEQPEAGDIKSNEKSKVSFAAGIKDTKAYKDELIAFRKIVKEKLKTIENLGIVPGQEELDEKGLTERAKKVEEIYMDIRRFFIGSDDEKERTGLINRLINDCIKQLGGLPKVGKDKHEVEYAIFGMGSLALGTMTLWSDLEFGILIEDGISPQDEARTKEYFRLLTTLLHIKVVNFGETALRMMGIEELNNFKVTEKTDAEHNWFYDDLIKPGFSFDGPHWHACKTPLGRREYKNHEDFELICVPLELLYFQKDKWYSKYPSLSQALCNLIMVSGNKELIYSYNLGLKNNEYITNRVRESFKILIQDNQIYQLKLLGDNIEGALINVKKEVYRFVDRIITALLTFFEVYENENWSSIIKLKEKGIELNVLKNLKIALSIATELRLRVYSANKGQIENFSALRKIEEDAKISSYINHDKMLKEAFYLQNIELLCRFFYTIIPLQSFIISHQSILKFRNGIKNQKFYLKDDLSQAMVNQKLMKYEVAKNYYEKAINSGLSQEKLILAFNSLGYICDMLAKYDEAILCYNKVLILKGNIDPDGNVMNNLGIVYQNKGEYIKALIYLNKALEIIKRNSDIDFCDIDISINLASLYKKIGNYNMALLSLENALTYEQIYNEGSADHATILDALGMLYQDKGLYQKAKLSFEQALNYKIKIFGKSHLEYSDSLKNIASIYYDEGNYNLAIIYYKQALLIKEEILGKEHHLCADILEDLGNIYLEIDDMSQAEVYLQAVNRIRVKSLEIGNPKHLNSLHNRGVFYFNNSNYNEAIKYSEQAVLKRKELLGKKHPEYATSLHTLGNIYRAQGETKKAIECFKKALAIFDCALGTRNTKKISVLHSLGNVYGDDDHHNFAIDYYNQALSLVETLFGKSHPHCGVIVGSIGNTYSKVGEYELAIKYFYNGLSTIEQSLGRNHLSYSFILNNLGATYHNMKLCNKAIDIYKEVLVIKEIILGKKNSSYATTLFNLSLVYAHQNQFEQAINCLKEVLTIQEETIGEDHQDTIATLRSLSSALSNQGENELAAEYQSRICTLLPDDRGSMQDLACYYHAAAYKFKLTDSIKYYELISMAKNIFNTALDMNSDEPIQGGLYADFIMFSLMHCDVNNKKEFKVIARYLRDAINIADDQDELVYSKSVKHTLIKPLQKLLEERNEIVVKASILIGYLSIKLRLIYKQDIIKGVNAFINIVKKLEDYKDCWVGYYLLSSHFYEANSEKVADKYLYMSEVYHTLYIAEESEANLIKSSLVNLFLNKNFRKAKFMIHKTFDQNIPIGVIFSYLEDEVRIRYWLSTAFNSTLLPICDTTFEQNSAAMDLIIGYCESIKLNNEAMVVDRKVGHKNLL